MVRAEAVATQAVRRRLGRLVIMTSQNRYEICYMDGKFVPRTFISLPLAKSTQHEGLDDGKEESDGEIAVLHVHGVQCVM